MLRRLQLLILAVVLIVAAFTTGYDFLFFLIYVGALIWVGTTLAWGSFLEGEGTGTPWNPRIWPVKFAIPLAGLLLLLQGVSNLLRDLGAANPKSRAT